MKYIIIFVFLFFGCSNPKEEVKKGDDFFMIDSLILQSQKKLEILNSTSKSTDSTITGKVENTVKKITKLKEENIKLKQENEILKDKLDEANDVGKPFKLLPISHN